MTDNYWNTKLLKHLKRLLVTEKIEIKIVNNLYYSTNINDKLVIHSKC